MNKITKSNVNNNAICRCDWKRQKTLLTSVTLIFSLGRHILSQKSANKCSLKCYLFDQTIKKVTIDLIPHVEFENSTNNHQRYFCQRVTSTDYRRMLLS